MHIFHFLHGTPEYNTVATASREKSTLLKRNWGKLYAGYYLIAALRGPQRVSQCVSFFSLFPWIEEILSLHHPAVWFSRNSPLMLMHSAKPWSRFMAAICGTQYYQPKLTVNTRPHNTAKLELYPKIYSGLSGGPCPTLLPMASHICTLLPIECNGLLAK